MLNSCLGRVRFLECFHERTRHFPLVLSLCQCTGGIGRAYSHRIPLVKLKCIAPKRWIELAARRRGEEPGGERRVESARYGRPRSLFRPGS